MNETLKKRQIELLQTLKERFREQPQRWWQQKEKTYKTTWDVGNTYEDYQVPSEEITIRYNLKAAIYRIAALHLFMFLFFYQSWSQDSGNPYISITMLMIFVMLELRSIVDRKPKIVITSKSIWFQKLKMEIAWEDFMASYIEEDHSSDSITRSLILFHYDRFSDTIYETTMKLNDDLEMNDAMLCYYIEYWKIKTGNRTPTV